jgi:hypothetical protein
MWQLLVLEFLGILIRFGTDKDFQANEWPGQFFLTVCWQKRYIVASLKTVINYVICQMHATQNWNAKITMDSSYGNSDLDPHI